MEGWGRSLPIFHPSNHTDCKEVSETCPLCPDFVVELRSRSDALETLQEKMQEYIANGAQLGWLIDPQEKKVYIYRIPYEGIP